MRRRVPAAVTVFPLLVLLGAIGAAFAVRGITRADPLTALGSAR